MLVVRAGVSNIFFSQVRDGKVVFAGEPSHAVLGVTTISIIGVSTAVLIIDLVYPLLDPRVRVT